MVQLLQAVGKVGVGVDPVLAAQEVQVFVGEGDILQLEWDNLLFVVKGKAHLVADMAGAVCILRGEKDKSGTLPDRVDDLRGVVAAGINISGCDPALYALAFQIFAYLCGCIGLLV